MRRASRTDDITQRNITSLHSASESLHATSDNRMRCESMYINIAAEARH